MRQKGALHLVTILQISTKLFKSMFIRLYLFTIHYVVDLKAGKLQKFLSQISMQDQLIKAEISWMKKSLDNS